MEVKTQGKDKELVNFLACRLSHNLGSPRWVENSESGLR